MRFKLRSKLQLAFFTLILLASMVGVVSFIYLYRIYSFQSLKNQVDDLIQLHYQQKDAARNFLVNDTKTERFYLMNESLHFNEFKKHSQQILTLLTNIEENHLSQKLELATFIRQIRKSNAVYQKNFDQLIQKIKHRGYGEYGMEGKLTYVYDTLHQMLTDSSTKSLLLALRNKEKEFVLNKNTEEVKQAEALMNQLANLNLGNPYFIESLNKYDNYFHRLVDDEASIGLTSASGLRGLVQQNNVQQQRELEKLQSLIGSSTSSLASNSTWIILAFFATILCISFILSLYFYYSITSPIQGLERIARSLTKGIRNQDIHLDNFQSKDEIESLAKSFKHLVLKLKKTLYQARENSNKLEEYRQNEAQRNWVTEGLAIFSEIFRKNYEDTEQQSFEIISELVKYTKSAQGGIFILNRENPEDTYLELKGCYAYDRKKYQQKRIDFGEGLVGTAWKQEHTILVNELPVNYSYIHSGLGKSKPNALLIVPIKSDEGVEGVVELISFHKYSELEIQFLETLAERIASTIIATKVSAQTKDLLASTEKIARISQEKENRLQKQIQDYQYWIQEFESKLNAISEESYIYQSIINRVYGGVIITDAQFRITKVNNYVLKKLKFEKGALEGLRIDDILEIDFQNIIDLKDRRHKLNYILSQQNSKGKLTDNLGNEFEIESLAGKLELEEKIIYIFLFNEKEALGKEIKLKVAS